MWLSARLGFLKRQSLINKMMVLNSVGIATAMLVVLVIFSILYSYLARQSLAENLLAEARLLATNTAPMLAFYDKDEADKLAATFKQMSNLLRIVVFDKQHDRFVDRVATEDDYHSYPVDDLISGITSDTARFETDRLLVLVPIYIESERMGTVVMESSLASIKTSLLWFVSIGTMATVLGILFSLVTLRKLQIWALAPIINMSNLVEQVATHRSYNLRASVDGSDEVARLAGRLNQMLERIEIWDKDLNEEINQRRESERHLDTLARTDELTKLPNRLAFVQDLEGAVAGTLDAGLSIALLFIDLDDFKQVNDTYGHQCGDTVLQVTAERFAGTLRDTDMLYRLGGDEFAAVLTGLKEEHQAYVICERLIAAAGRQIRLEETEDAPMAKIGASVGLAFCPADATSSADLLHRADLAMYEAKRNGKNLFKPFDRAMEPEPLPQENG